MGSSLRIEEVIRMGESEGKTFYEIIEASYPFGWRTFDHAVLEAFEQGLIAEETALLYCSKRSVAGRGIDNVKKARGELTELAGSLRMKAPVNTGGNAGAGAAATGGNAAPPILKVK